LQDLENQEAFAETLLTTASDLLARASLEKGDHAPFPTAPEASRYPGLTDTEKISGQCKLSFRRRVL